MYGYSGDPLIWAEKGIVKNIYSGHVGVYIGREDGVDYVVEALSDGLVKTPAKYFVNTGNQEEFLGAKLPKGLSPVRQAKAVALAKNLAKERRKYDFNFRQQKGPESGDWTCVGLAEKIYESADISNPNNLAALEYDPDYYAIDITPDGYDNYSVVNDDGDCFSQEREFSKISRREDLLIPAPELIGYNVGREYGDERYIFLPYTQFLQPTLEEVPVDIEVSSSFSETAVRGQVSTLGLVLRWSLIDNPWSSLKKIWSETKALALGIGEKILGPGSGTELSLSETAAKRTASSSKKTTASQKTTKKVAKKATVKVVKTTKKATTAGKEEEKTKAAVTKKVSKNSGVASPSGVAKSAVQANDTLAPVKGLATVTATVTAATEEKAVSQTPVYYVSVANSSQPAAEPPSLLPIVINKVFASGANHWVELYNPTSQDFDLAANNYRLEKTKTADDPGLALRFGNDSDGSYPGGTVIKAHDTYLVVSSDASAYYRDQADAIATRDDFSWKNSGYTLYLGAGAISSSADPDIIDAVGFGPEATYFLGTGPALAIADYYFLDRIGNSENNQADFKLTPASDPESLAALAAAADIALTASTTATTTTVETATTTSETAGGTATTSSQALAVIKRIYGTGDNDWIELYNPTADPLDLAAAGYRLEKAKTADDPSLMMRFGDLLDGSYPGGTVISPQSSYLVVRDEANSYYLSQADAIATRDEFGWLGSGYSLYLGNGPISSSSDQNIIDLVGFGSEAVRFLGSGPAPELADNYILNRISNSRDNSLDFNLLLTDDPNAVWPSADPEETDFSALADLYISPSPIVSDGLAKLWHFDSCLGEGKWLVGKWDCGREVGFRYDPVELPLDSPLNLNELSASFYFRRTENNPRVSLRLANGDGSKLNLILETDLITVEGLPNSAWRYPTNLLGDYLWHQAIITVDRVGNYWTLYIDGEERIRQFFLNHLAEDIDRLVLSSDDGPVAIDEIALWSRPLSAAEAAAYYVADAPLSPLTERPAQVAATLLHFWDFDEGEGAAAYDSLSSSTLSIRPDLWALRSLTASGLTLTERAVSETVFDPPIVSDDLSLEFWWRSSSYPKDSRANVFLLAGEKKVLALSTESFITSFWFNGNYGVFTMGYNQAAPDDDKWHHLATVYDSYRQTLSFYADGERKSVQYFVRPLAGLEAGRLRIGTDSSDSQIDSLGIWRGALSAAQVERLYRDEKGDFGR